MYALFRSAMGTNNSLGTRSIALRTACDLMDRLKLMNNARRSDCSLLLDSRSAIH